MAALEFRAQCTVCAGRLVSTQRANDDDDDEGDTHAVLHDEAYSLTVLRLAITRHGRTEPRGRSRWGTRRRRRGRARTPAPQSRRRCGKDRARSRRRCGRGERSRNFTDACRAADRHTASHRPSPHSALVPAAAKADQVWLKGMCVSGGGAHGQPTPASVVSTRRGQGAYNRVGDEYQDQKVPKLARRRKWAEDCAAADDTPCRPSAVAAYRRRPMDDLHASLPRPHAKPSQVLPITPGCVWLWSQPSAADSGQEQTVAP